MKTLTINQPFRQKFDQSYQNKRYHLSLFHNFEPVFFFEQPQK